MLKENVYKKKLCIVFAVLFFISIVPFSVSAADAEVVVASFDMVFDDILNKYENITSKCAVVLLMAEGSNVDILTDKQAMIIQIFKLTDGKARVGITESSLQRDGWKP